MQKILKLIKMNRRILYFLFVLFGLLIEFTNTQKILLENASGQIDDYNYELWKDTGITQMTLLGGGKFRCSWSNVNNVLFRIGKEWDCTYHFAKNISILVDYNVDFRPTGNAFMYVYGWTRNPLIEYYIVENWGTWRPPGGYPVGTISFDNDIYDIYVTNRINQPSIDGISTFKQYWSVRTSKSNRGTVYVDKHFHAWTGKNLEYGSMCETSFIIKASQGSGLATVNNLHIFENFK